MTKFEASIYINAPTMVIHAIARDPAGYLNGLLNLNKLTLTAVSPWSAVRRSCS